MLQLNGPLLIACNHPDSFLDAIILATLFRRPVYSLAAGSWGAKGATFVDLKKVKPSLFKEALTISYENLQSKK